MKAILIDDEQLALQGLKMNIESTGFVDVDAVFLDAKDALEYLENHCPDVIFLDIEMPGLNGLELFEHMMKLQPETRIVFVTAYREFAVEAYELNAADYLIKPVPMERLIKTLNRIRESKADIFDHNLEIRCFGHFSIYHNSLDINVKWRTRKSEELIAFLICNNGNYVSKEKIADTLWPELDGDKSMANLYLAYYYVNKLKSDYGVSIPLRSARGKMRIEAENVKCDLIRFIELAEQVSTVAQTNLELAEKALALYGQEPFEDSYFPWLVDYQHKFEKIRMDLKYRVEAYKRAK